MPCAGEPRRPWRTRCRADRRGDADDVERFPNDVDCVSEAHGDAPRATTGRRRVPVCDADAETVDEVVRGVERERLGRVLPRRLIEAHRDELDVRHPPSRAQLRERRRARRDRARADVPELHFSGNGRNSPASVSDVAACRRRPNHASVAPGRSEFVEPSAHRREVEHRADDVEDDEARQTSHQKTSPQTSPNTRWPMRIPTGVIAPKPLPPNPNLGNTTSPRPSSRRQPRPLDACRSSPASSPSRRSSERHRRSHRSTTRSRSTGASACSSCCCCK